jgi:hypothetical protein
MTTAQALTIQLRDRVCLPMSDAADCGTVVRISAEHSATDLLVGIRWDVLGRTVDYWQHKLTAFTLLTVAPELSNVA